MHGIPYHNNSNSSLIIRIKSKSQQQPANLNSNAKTTLQCRLSTNSISIHHQSNTINDTNSRRRKILQQGIISIISATIPTTTLAATPSTESIRKAASNIPGYGVPDVYYPPYFLGKWIATRSTILSLNNNSNNKDMNPSVNTITHPMRFLSNEDNLIISDRGYNLKSQIQNDASTITSTQSSINTVQWESSNPNVITVQNSNGSFLENKVTKRLVENTPDYFLSSEFLRISLIPVNDMPTIVAQRVLTKWRKKPLDSDGDYIIEGMELVYDPTDNSYSSGKLISKSLIRLERDISNR